jgi:hypothetical protein
MSSTFFFFWVPHKSRGSLSIYRPVLDMRKEIDRELASKLQTFCSASQHYLFINKSLEIIYRAPPEAGC